MPCNLRLTEVNFRGCPDSSPSIPIFQPRSCWPSMILLDKIAKPSREETRNRPGRISSVTRLEKAPEHRDRESLSIRESHTQVCRFVIFFFGLVIFFCGCGDLRVAREEPIRGPFWNCDSRRTRPGHTGRCRRAGSCRDGLGHDP